MTKTDMEQIGLIYENSSSGGDSIVGRRFRLDGANPEYNIFEFHRDRWDTSLPLDIINVETGESFTVAPHIREMGGNKFTGWYKGHSDSFTGEWVDSD